MHLSLKALYPEDYCYSSLKTPDELNLSGSFYGPYSFQLNPKYEFGYVHGLGTGSRLVYLDGVIFPDGSRSLVKVTVRPNAALRIMFFAVPAALLFGALTADKNSSRPTELLGLVFSAVIFAAFIWLACAFKKQGFRKRFARNFQLEEVPDTLV